MDEHLWARHMRPGDGAAVARLWQGFLPPSQEWTAWLPDLLDTLLERRAVLGGVVFAGTATPRCAGAGISCFLDPQELDDFNRTPRPYLNARLLNRYREGETSVFLTPDAQAAFNGGAGLDMFVLDYVQESFDFSTDWAHRILNTIIPVYVGVHAGFNIRRSQHETEVAVGHIQIAGGNPYLFDVAPQDAHSLSDAGRGPRAVYGVSRDSLSESAATGIARSLLFAPRARFRLVPREQETVRLALDSLTDTEIATQMGLSRDRVRQIWQGIYAHLEDMEPGVFDGIAAPAGQMKRGGEKRRVTMAYLRDRPEELRPNARSRRGRVVRHAS